MDEARTAFSICLRIKKSLRSNAPGAAQFAPRAMNTWRISGSVARTPSPSPALFTGTRRQPSRRCPSARTNFSTASFAPRSPPRARGKKTMPAAYSPSGGKSKLVSSRRNLRGNCSKMPAPSPAAGSAPTAPRWRMLFRISRPSETMPRLLRPVMSATKPTPHASCSRAGSYKPHFAGGPPAFIPGFIMVRCWRNVTRPRRPVTPLRRTQKAGSNWRGTAQHTTAGQQPAGTAIRCATPAAVFSNPSAAGAGPCRPAPPSSHCRAGLSTARRRRRAHAT